MHFRFQTAYTYDAASRVASIDSRLDGLTSYNYDYTNQLLSADYATQNDESYSYDANGNRTGEGYSTGQNNLIQSDGTYQYLYDLEGNRIRKTDLATTNYTVYQYDHRNRLVHVEDIVPNPEPSWDGVMYYDWHAPGYSEGNWGPWLCLESVGCGWGDFTVRADWAVEGEYIPVTASASVVVGSQSYSLDVEYYIGPPTEEPSWTPFPEGTLSIPTTYDPGYQWPTTIDLHFRVVGNDFGVDLGPEVWDQLDCEFDGYQASIHAAVEGSDAFVTLLPNEAELPIEFYIDGVTAQEGIHYTDPTNTSPTQWNTVSELTQFFVPTSNIAVHEGTRYFALHVRLVGDPQSEEVVQGIIYDTLDPIIQTVDYTYDAFNQLVRRGAELALARRRRTLRL